LGPKPKAIVVLGRGAGGVGAGEAGQEMNTFYICGGTIPIYPRNVFVRVPHRTADWYWEGLDWVAMPTGEAERSRQHIIRCIYCDQPASQLDGFYPWSAAHNLCSKHAAMPREGWGKEWPGHKGHYFRNGHSLCWRYEIEGYTFPGRPIPKRPYARCLKRAARRTQP